MKTGLTANGTSKSTIAQFDSIFNGKQELDRTEPCLLPVFHATTKAERRNCLDLGEEVIKLSVLYSPKYMTYSDKFGQNKDNIVQQGVQGGKSHPRKNSSAIEVSSFCYDGDTDCGVSADDKMEYHPSAQSENVDYGQWLPHFRISSLKYMFRLPCIRC